MSYPYPQDRNRNRREQGEQPYKDAKEAMAQQEADLENQVKGENAPDLGVTEPGDISDEMTDRLRQVNDEISQWRHDEQDA